MLGAMQMPPPPSNPKKSLSLRERMTLHRSSRSHASVCSPDAQHAGQRQAAPQRNTPTTIPQPQTEHLLPSAKEDLLTSGPSSHDFPPIHELGIEVHSTVGMAACRPSDSEDYEGPAVVQLHDGLLGSEDSGDDMTQEDLPIGQVAACVELPDATETPQPLHPCFSPQQSKSEPQARSEVDIRQPQAKHEEAPQLDRHAVEGGAAEDDEACWEQALEAEMQGMSGGADEHVSGRRCSDAEVMQLDVESADDLLNVLADAAADTSPVRCRIPQYPVTKSVYYT